MNLITIGFYAEGPTDNRFLLSIIRRTFEAVALECESEIEVYEPQPVTAAADTFAATVVAVARVAAAQGALVLCVHADADARDDEHVRTHKVSPALAALQNAALPGSPALVALIPVRMSEAWMLADKTLLKDEIGTSLSDAALGLHRAPEAYADPKAVIEESIRLAHEDRPRRHRQQLTIGEIYLPLGQKIALARLAALPSYQRFRADVRQAFRQLNYLH